MNTLAEIDLKQLLKICTDPANKYFQHGWVEFDRRYRSITLAAAHKIESNRHDVEDIIATVMARLVSNDFKVLNNFRKKESEASFRAYLHVMTKKTALGHLKKKEKKNTIPLNPELQIEGEIIKNGDKESYKNTVLLLRAKLSKTQKRKLTQERDIIIFLMRHFGFKSKDVSEVSLFDTSAHNIDIVVNRLRKLINRNNK